jgi:hypothetical protein
MRVLRLARVAFVWVVLLAMALAGFNDALGSVVHADTALKKLALSTELAYSVLSIVGLVGLAMKRRWTVGVMVVWAVAVVATAVLATIGWGGAGVGAGIAAGVGTAVLATLVVWAAYGVVS